MFTMRMIRPLLAAVLVGAAALTGCARIPLGAPVASAGNILKAQGTGMAPANVGTFGVAVGKDPAIDKVLVVRSNKVLSPFDESFAKYLGETLRTELKAAGLLDPASATSLEGSLTDNVLDGPIGRGTGRLGARFVVRRAGKTLYDKQHQVDANWDSPFIGAVAIPTAINEYSALHRKLVGSLLDDPVFRQAVSR